MAGWLIDGWLARALYQLWSFSPQETTGGLQCLTDSTTILPSQSVMVIVVSWGRLRFTCCPFSNGYHSKASKAFKQKERLQKKKSHHNFPGTCYSSALHHAVMLIRFYVGCRAKPMFGWLAPPRGRGEKIAMNYQFLELEHLLLLFGVWFSTYPIAGCGGSLRNAFLFYQGNSG